MKTEKLYYKDAYLKEFSSVVVECTQVADRFIVVLEATAFVPEGGGQSSDRGYMADSAVIDVKEKGGVIYHTVDKPFAVGDRVDCRVDFGKRFEKMQMHTAEHILSGLMYSNFGLQNIGFHLTDSGVTFDTDKKIEKSDLDMIEMLANRAIYENHPVRAYFPSADELKALSYRSKLDLYEDVRIVDIDGIDKCACCAPHVSYTGEIGLIKILSSESHRGGTRIFMLAGERALLYVRELHNIVSELSAMLSSPSEELAQALSRFLEAKAALEYKISKKDEIISRIFSEKIEIGTKVSVTLLPVDGIDGAMSFINEVSEKCDITVALFGEEKDYRYVIKTKKEDVGPIVRSANAALSGKGGGRADIAQGRFSSTFTEIENYFKNL